MKTTTWMRSSVLACAVLLLRTASLQADHYWQVDDIRAGMKGVGRTVIKGTKIESFDAVVLGILKNTSPGRDMVLCRLSGCDLDKTGVIAGMSGSPVYIDGKLLGAVAYAWPFGKEPIAGITPFCQMQRYAESYEQRDLSKPREVGLSAPVRIDDRTFATVKVSDDFAGPQPTAADGLWMVPLRAPLAASGFTSHSLKLLGERLSNVGLVPVQGGGVSAQVAEAAMNTPLVPGGALTIALIQGDFDLSGIGTVTHIEGKRVYGWGHPFMSLGACDFPMMTGYVHTIYPRQNLSFKMGSPLRTVGVINADISTCIAGWLDKKPDLLPVSMTVARLPGERARIFNVKVVRQRSLLASLVYTALTNAIDMEGELPEELTAQLKAKIEIEGHAPIVLEDTFSGAIYSGGRTPQALYQPVAQMVNALLVNHLEPLRIENITCTTHIRAGRSTADIDGVAVETECVRPGETLQVAVFLKPHKGQRQRVLVRLPVPADLPDGEYTAIVSDDTTCVRSEMRTRPELYEPATLAQHLEALRLQTSVKRTHLAIRMPLASSGVALEGKALPSLPASVAHILSNSRRSGAQSFSSAVVARQPTDWVIHGTETVRFRVSKQRSSNIE